MTYYLCDSERANCPASELPRSMRNVMWGKGMVVAAEVKGAERRGEVEAAIAADLPEAGVTQFTADDVARLATSLMCIVDNHCVFDKIVNLK